MWSVLHCVHLRVSKGMIIITANILVACVTSKRDRKYCNGSKASAAARLSLFIFFLQQPPGGQGFLIHEASRSHNDAP